MQDSDYTASPSASGIVHCLKLLAEEAASLNLIRTLSAIEDALDMAACECGSDRLGEGAFFMPCPPVLH